MKIHNSFIGILCFIALAAAFGKNKVQYKPLPWLGHTTSHFKTYFPPDQGELPRITDRWLEQGYRQLQSEFGYNPPSPIPVILSGTSAQFEQTNVIPELIPEGVGGFTEMVRNRMVIPFDGNWDGFRHVLHHELVHAFQFSMMAGSSGERLLRMQGAATPLWFAEGSAEYLSSGWDCEADMYMMDLTINDVLPAPGPDMDGYFAYKGGQSFLHFLESSRGDSAFHALLAAFRDSRRVEESIEKIYRQPLTLLGEEWRKECRRLYWPELGSREDLSERARRLTGTESQPRSFFNLKPRISPDGSRVAYYSDARDFTEIFIADSSGKVKQRIGQFRFQGQFESFAPFRSGMCFSPDGTKLACITRAEGRDHIWIYDLKKRRFSTRITPRPDMLWSPDWSPDGTQIVFCGSSEGESQLWICDTAGNNLRSLTKGLQSRQSPRFSPDGTAIVFCAQDSSGSALRSDSLRPPSWDLYLLTPADSVLRRLSATPENEKSVCFSPDGKKLAFSSDRCGIADIYIGDIDTLAKARALTDIIGGCEDPDWSRQSGALVFSLFAEQHWDVWRFDAPLARLHDSLPKPTRWMEHLLLGSPFYRSRPIPPDTAHADTMPDLIVQGDSGNAATEADSLYAGDAPAPDSAVDTLGRSHTTRDSSLSPALSDSSLNLLVAQPYRPDFAIDMASIGAAYTGYYGFAGQSAVFLSDLMGDHRIGIAGAIANGISENDISLSYLNSRYRINFGAAFFHSQYFTNSYFLDRSGIFLYQDNSTGGQLSLSRPFSLFSRLDFDLYYRNWRSIPFIDGGRRPQRDNSRAIRERNITEPSISWVYDNCLWGLTGPLAGSRAKMHLTVAPAFTKVDEAYAAFDFDARHYWHIAQTVVVAGRLSAGMAQPLGRSETQRRYVLGGSENWINYRLNTAQYFEHLESSAFSSMVVPFRGWDYYDLSGSRFALANAELRFPFIEDISFEWPLPFSINYINGALFSDIGNAWDRSDETNGVLPGKCYGGLGYGLRMNMGIFILRYDRAWQTDWVNWVRAPRNYFSLGAEF